jgi:hypothetical protein
MDIKITSPRLKNLLSYEWIKMIVAVVAGIIVWTLLFTTLGTRITVGEEFTFVIYEDVYTLGDQNKNSKILSDLKKSGGFSYDVLNTKVSSITSAGQYTASYMLTIRAAAHEGDVMIASDGRAVPVDEKGKDAQGKIPTEKFNSAISTGLFFDINTFLKRAHGYTVGNGFITENSDGSYTVNDSKISEYFLSVRMSSAGNYRKTYRTDEQKKQAVANEIIRITAVYENYLFIKNAIDTATLKGNDFLWYYQPKDEGGNAKGEPIAYGIDLYKLNLPFEDKRNLEDDWFVYAGEKTTAEGLVLCVFNFESEQADMQYEALAFIRYMIETYSGY